MSEFFVKRDETIFGPLSTAKLKQFVTAGRVRPVDSISRKKTGPWQQAGTVTGLFPEDAAPAKTVQEPDAPVAEMTAPSANNTEFDDMSDAVSLINPGLASDDASNQAYLAADSPVAQSPQSAPSGISRVIPMSNPCALIGYYLGIFSLILGCLALPGAILGLIGLIAVLRNPQKRGMGHAITALVISLIVTPALYVVLWFVMFNAAR